MSGPNLQSNDINTGETDESPVIKNISMTYVCGECHSETVLSPKDLVRCRECGFRILYKKKTSRIVVYDGR